MLSKAQIKYIRSLRLQKIREEYNLFVAEGDKIVAEWLQSSAHIEKIVALEPWLETHSALMEGHPETEVLIAAPSDLEAVSLLQTPNHVFAVIQRPKGPKTLPAKGWSIALDEIQDPGNMGTIIRIADWFGIQYIICAPGCVDVYNPKVVQAAMGSHLRLQFHEADLVKYIQSVKTPVIAAALNGTSLNAVKPFAEAVLVIGNESKGISEKVLDVVDQKITIPRIGGAESLNAAVATGIICNSLVPSSQ